MKKVYISPSIESIEIIPETFLSSSIQKTDASSAKSGFLFNDVETEEEETTSWDDICNN